MTLKFQPLNFANHDSRRRASFANLVCVLHYFLFFHFYIQKFLLIWMIDLTLRHVVALLADRFRYFNPLIVSYRPTLAISQGLVQKVTQQRQI